MSCIISSPEFTLFPGVLAFSSVSSLWRLAFWSSVVWVLFFAFFACGNIISWRSGLLAFRYYLFSLFPQVCSLRRLAFWRLGFSVVWLSGGLAFGFRSLGPFYLRCLAFWCSGVLIQYLLFPSDVLAFGVFWGFKVLGSLAFWRSSSNPSSYFSTFSSLWRFGVLTLLLRISSFWYLAFRRLKLSDGPASWRSGILDSIPLLFLQGSSWRSASGF